jgi:hypothetical protein
MRNRWRVAVAVAVVVGVAVLFGAIVLLANDGDAQASRDSRYIQLAVHSSAGQASGIVALFPTKPDSDTCKIPRGGPSPGALIPGTCTTSVRPAGNGEATVTFVESWDARDFSGSGHGLLSHTWEMTVSEHLLGGDKVIRNRSYGDFPPQWVR